jgi:hypothetical protein
MTGCWHRVLPIDGGILNSVDWYQIIISKNDMNWLFMVIMVWFFKKNYKQPISYGMNNNTYAINDSWIEVTKKNID